MGERRGLDVAPRAWCRAALLTLLCLLALLPAGAQETPPAGGAGVEPPAKPAAIPAGEISQRSQALEARLQQIRALRPTRALERLEGEIEDAQQEALIATERAEALLARRHTPSEIERLSARWQRLDTAFASLGNRVGREISALGDDLAELADEAADWQETLREARRLGAAPAVEREIRRVLGRLSEARGELGADLEVALALRNDVRQLRSSLTPILERLAGEQEEFFEGLFTRQAEPVWSALPAGLATVPDLGAAIATEVSGLWDEAGSYARTQGDLLAAQCVLFAIVLWLLLHRQARRRLDPGESTPGALGNPWATAFLVAVLLSPLFQPERSRGFLLVVSPLVLVAWYRVLAGMLPPMLHAPLRGLAVLMGIEIVRFVFIGISLVDRTLLVVDLGIALLGTLWLRRPQRLRFVPWRQARNPWMRALGAWMQLGTSVLALGLGAALLGYTSLADCIAMLTIFGTVVGAAWLALVRVVELAVEPLVLEGPLGRVRMIQRSPHGFLFILRRILRLSGLAAWAYVTLSRAGLWSPVRSGIVALFSFPLGFGAVTVSVGALLAFGLTLWLSWALSRFIALALNEEVFTRVRLPPGVPFALSTLTRYSIFVVGFVVAMGSIGFSFDRVTLLLSALGVGIGFGLQSVVNNFVSGMILLFERPIRVGDWVQMGNLFGTVTSIGIRASKVKTFDGADVVVPNADFVSSQVTNWTLSDPKRRMILPVGVAYGTDPRRVMDLLVEVARAHPQVLETPEAHVLFKGFGESSLNFELRAFTAGDWLAVSSDLYVAAHEALQAAGIEIPFPQRDLHLRTPEALRGALEASATPARSGVSEAPDP